VWRAHSLRAGEPGMVSRLCAGVAPAHIPSHRGRRIQPVEMEKVLQAALHEQPPRSLRQVTQRCEASPRTIRQHFPHLCQAITARFADYRTIRAAVRKEVARAEVKSRRLRTLCKRAHNHTRPLTAFTDQF